MKHTDISEIFKNSSLLETQVTVCGWVRTSRDSKSMAFIELNDGTTLKHLQIVINKADFDDISDYMKLGTALKVTGKAVKSAVAADSVEINAESIAVLGECPPDYPLQKKRHTLEYLRTIPHLRVRTNTFNAVFRVRSVVSACIHEFFQSRGFVYVRENESLMDGAQSIVENALERCVDEHVRDWNSVKTRVREALSSYIYRRTKRSPMILPILMEV